MIITAFLFSAFLSFTAKADDSLATPTEASIANYKMSLNDRDGNCILVANDKLDIATMLKWPCEFHLDKNSKLRIGRAQKNPVFLIEHSAKSPEPSHDCDTRVQGVRLMNGKLEASPTVTRSSACPPIVWKDKVFEGLFPTGKH